VFWIQLNPAFSTHIQRVILLSAPLLLHSMGQIIKSLLSFCLSVCKHSYGRNFDSILMKFCTVIRGPKSKIKFVWDKNLITPSLILLQFLKICITAYGDFKAV